MIYLVVLNFFFFYIMCEYFVFFPMLYKGVVFSSPELKVQVSFSDQNLSIVRHRRCCCRHCCRKLWTFSSSSPEPLGQFQLNLAQSILGWRVFKFVQMKGPVFFQGEIIMKLQKIHWQILKIFFSRTPANFNQTWHKSRVY